MSVPATLTAGRMRVSIGGGQSSCAAMGASAGFSVHAHHTVRMYIINNARSGSEQCPQQQDLGAESGMPKYITFIDITRRREHGHFIVSGWVEAENQSAAEFAALKKRGKNARVKAVPWDEMPEEAQLVAIEKGQVS